MTYTTIEKQGQQRSCTPLPWVYAHRLGDVIQCDDCGQRWLLVLPWVEGRRWACLRWYHFRAQRRLRGSSK